MLMLLISLLNFLRPAFYWYRSIYRVIFAPEPPRRDSRRLAQVNASVACIIDPGLDPGQEYKRQKVIQDELDQRRREAWLSGKSIEGFM